MSRIKEFYHEQICEGLRQQMEDADLNRQYEEHMQDRAKHFGLKVHDPLTLDDIKAINDAQLEEDHIEAQAEQQAFVDLAYRTGTLPA